MAMTTKQYEVMSYREFDSLVTTHLSDFAAVYSANNFLESTGLPNGASKCYDSVKADDADTSFIRHLLVQLIKRGVLAASKNYMIVADVVA
jgi:hypothetical protein